MDNASRSERSRNAALQAALTIIARDGAGRLTLDAIARESGISKGGVMHQFRTKEAVIKALLELQREHFEAFADQFMAKHGAGYAEPRLATEIAVQREATTMPHSVAFAVLGALAEQPNLLAFAKEIDGKKLETIKAEAADPQLAVLRWTAAKGLLMTTLLGTCPIPAKERDQLFDRLLDDSQWQALAKPKQAKSKSAR
ncbi:MAG TPA: TetR/AcrR family transcriptional regulator, partial [Terriglobales bacterium]|nr:TetR/AcrR family transcriptional regulator [Terriglobales bacterium]